jgi:hypothetical protein
MSSLFTVASGVAARPRTHGKRVAGLDVVHRALAFVGVPPPVIQSLKPEQQEQGETLKKGK